MRFPLSLAILIVCWLRFAYAFDDEDEVDQGIIREELLAISSKDGVIRLDRVSIEEYVDWSLRNYSFFILFTATSQYPICQPASDEFVLVAQSFRRVYSNSDRFFFGIVDYADDTQIFEQLEVKTVPVVAFIPVEMQLASGLTLVDLQTMYVNGSSLAAEIIGHWVAKKAELSFPVVRPPGYLRNSMLAGSILAGCAAAYLVWAYSASVWRLSSVLRGWCSTLWRRWKGTLWRWIRTAGAIALLVLSLLIASGHIYNRIRRPQWYHQSSNGLGIVCHLSSYQYVSETYLICALHVCFAGCLITIVDGRFVGYCAGQAIRASAVLLAAFLFSALLSLFRFKMKRYPYGSLLLVEYYL